MANIVQRSVFGVDVAKRELVVWRDEEGRLETLANEPKAIKAWIKTLPPTAAIAIEATNTFHEDMVEQAHKAGIEVFIIDGYKLSNYRKGVGVRAKTDPSDASLLARYLRKEGDELRPWAPPPPAYRKIQSLLRRRAALVRSWQSVHLSLSGESQASRELSSLKKAFDHAVASLEKKIRDAIREAGLADRVRRIQAIEGIGPLTAAGLVMSFIRGDFSDADAYIAFLGMDLRVAESGQKRGRRALTKRGWSEIRRLLFNAGMSASRTDTWSGFYRYHLGRGLKTTEVFLMLARKLARIAFSLMKHDVEYQRQTRSYGVA